MPRPGPIKEEIETFQIKADTAETTQEVFDTATDDSRTRQQIAKIFVYIYFALLTLIIIGAPVYNIVAIRVTGRNDLVIPLTDIIQTYSAVVGPTLGFVIAYYFKSKND